MISQILFDACDKCDTLLKVQSLLNDPKYASKNRTAAEAVAPQFNQWLDAYSNEQLKSKNSDSKMLSDLKYAIQDGLQDKSTEASTSQLLNEFN